MDKKYWSKYYKSINITKQPSLFSQFILKKYLKEGDAILELGCGNGRDSIFFARHDINVMAIDQCKHEISDLSAKNRQVNLKFFCDDFTNLRDKYSSENIYSRFTLHSITEQEENGVIKWASEKLGSGGAFFIEVRGLKNELYKLGEKVKNEKNAYVYENHYRRFIDINILKKKLAANDFRIDLAEEESGFAPFKDTDYKFIRIVAIKN